MATGSSAVDIDPVKLDLIRARKSPILEEGIQELMRDVVDSGRVTVTQRCRAAPCTTPRCRSSASARRRPRTAART